LFNSSRAGEKFMKIVGELPRPVAEHTDVRIPLPDGSSLSARLWLPGGSLEHAVPAIVEYIPYRKRDFTAGRDARMHPYFAGHGYACLRIDLRGSGDSDGVLEDEYLEQELQDGVEALRWIARQPWCSGRIGMIGKSWGGFNGLQIAARRPPELAAVVSVCSSDDRYTDDVHYMGGCLLADNLSWASVMFAYNSCPPDPVVVGEKWRSLWHARLRDSGLWLDTWLQHQRRDDYWRHASICEAYEGVRCPVLLVSGWADGYSNAVLRMLEHLRVPRLGLIGPWGHRYPHEGMPGPAIGFLQECLRWWGRYLRDEDTGIEREPMLRAWMQDSVPPITSYEVRPGRWVAEGTWPSRHIKERIYELGLGQLTPVPAGRLTPRPADPTEEVPMSIQSPLSVGLFAGKWCSFSATPDLPLDQREEDGGALVFDSLPLGEALEILGAPVLDAEVSVDQPIAMLAARLSDVAPDDQATRITFGLLNLTHYEGNERPQALVPGRRYRIRLQLNDVAQVFPRGHRLRLSVSTSYWPVAWPPPRPVCLTVHTTSSHFILPERAPRPAEDEGVSFEPPESAPPLAMTVRQPRAYEWVVTRDLARDRSRLEVIKDEGAYRLDDIDLEVGRKTVERYEYRGNDFGSVRGEATTTMAFRRGDWDVKTHTRTVLRSDATHFYINAQIDAFEGERRIFAENYYRVIERDHV
jgi:uncharacterized protein